MNHQIAKLLGQQARLAAACAMDPDGQSILDGHSALTNRESLIGVQAQLISELLDNAESWMSRYNGIMADFAGMERKLRDQDALIQRAEAEVERATALLNSSGIGPLGSPFD